MFTYIKTAHVVAMTTDTCALINHIKFADVKQYRAVVVVVVAI